MKHIIKSILLTAVLACVTGCTTGYWADRGRDAADVFTVTGGMGFGAKARVGPVGFGLYAGLGSSGLRGGRVLDGQSPNNGLNSWPGPIPNSFDVQGLLWGYEELNDPECQSRGKLYIAETGWAPWFTRKKYNLALGYNQPPPIPLVDFPREFYTVKVDPAVLTVPPTARKPDLSFYTNIEIQGGFFGAFRLGFNPGELVDLLLGFVGVDIFGDDLERRKIRDIGQKDNP